MHITDELSHTLRKLRLSGVLQSLSARTQQAAECNLSHSEFLFQVLQDELQRRQAKQTDGRLRRAQFADHKTIEDFSFSFAPSIPKAQLLELATASFVPRHENICLLGPTGVGKTHLAQALGHRACLLGYQVLFLSASALMCELRASRADNTRAKRLARFAAVDVLIIDDLGLRPLIDDEPLDLYDVIGGAYERRSLIITSNRAMEEWPPLFREPLLANAALDRLLHHAHVIELSGHSYRNPPTEHVFRNDPATNAGTTAPPTNS